VSAPLDLSAETVQALADGSHDMSAWREQGRALAEADNARQWDIGDWLLAGAARLGRPAYPEALAIFRGYRKATLKDFATVALRVTALVRTNDLSWAHHKLVAKFKTEFQQELLAHALKHNWPLTRFRTYINRKYPSRKPARPKSIMVPFTEEEFHWLHHWAWHCGRCTEAEMIQRIVRNWREKYNRDEVGDPLYEQTQLMEVCGTF
jgi:hypothetical protein